MEADCEHFSCYGYMFCPIERQDDKKLLSEVQCRVSCMKRQRFDHRLIHALFPNVYTTHCMFWGNKDAGSVSILMALARPRT